MTFLSFDVLKLHVNAAYSNIKSQLETKENILCLDGEPYTGLVKKEEEGERLEQNYSNGLLHGIQKVFYQNGKIKSATMYTNGMENGRRIEYYSCGAKKLNANYCEGSIDGIYEEWDKFGILILRKTFFNGKLIAIKSN